MKKRTIIVIAVTGIAAAVCMAGDMFSIKCDNSNCTFKSQIDIGGGILARTATGYCTTCQKFVEIAWKNPSAPPDFKKDSKYATLSDNAPQKLGTVWNPATGEIASLYPCPKCKMPFMEIDSGSLRKAPSEIEGEKLTGLQRKLYCPHCKDRSIIVKSLGQSD